jgi:hypothetical protein
MDPIPLSGNLRASQPMGGPTIRTLSLPPSRMLPVPLPSHQIPLHTNLSSPLHNRIVNGLVDQAYLGCYTEIRRLLRARKLGRAVFRLPEVSIYYLHDLLLSSAVSQGALISDEVREEILWRGRLHYIFATSAYPSALSTGEVEIPPEGSESLPPLIMPVQPGTVASFPLRYPHVDTYIGNCRRTVLGGMRHTRSTLSSDMASTPAWLH